ncbi:hypothetical protein QJS10_CPA02g00585 [Acorus calamus]|uniref:Uncharacterized protein n=1 Tax=Acorus calamus TaxID=4465 RepID=A0AAV9FCG1_ACOCL|nr:hypothetical protein QJS10_CPA02g00585 [Acorus calamus]
MKEMNSPIFTPKSQTISSSSTSPPFSRHPYRSKSTTTSLSTYSSPLQPLSGVPFSWEHQPGIPKQPFFAPATPHDRLPLPPPLKKNSTTKTKKHPKKSPLSSSSTPKKKDQQPFIMDPFAEALLECSKEARGPTMEAEQCWRSPKVVRSISDRLGFYVDRCGWCKMACDVAESQVFLPRIRRIGAYNMLGGGGRRF